jgi:hypothetical protein
LSGFSTINNVESILSYLPLISARVVSGLLVLAFFNFSMGRKNMQNQSEQQISSLKTQTEQQIFSRIIDARLKLEDRRIYKNGK